MPPYLLLRAQGLLRGEAVGLEQLAGAPLELEARALGGLLLLLLPPLRLLLLPAALGLGRRAQGLATGGLLAGDLTEAPLQPIAGSIRLLDRPGLGVGRLLAAATA